MPGSNNRVSFSNGLRLESSAAEEWFLMQDAPNTNDVSIINNQGSPEGVVQANQGSICQDNLNGNMYLKRTGTGVTGWVLISTSATTDLHVARYSVSAGGAPDGANYVTIASAITAAVSAGGVQTIAIQPGTYTENITLPANINLTGLGCDALTPAVTIRGTITCTDAGSRTIAFINLATNGATSLSVTGSVATNVNLTNCFFTSTDAFSIVGSSSGGATITLYNCFSTITSTNSLYTLTNNTNLYVFGGKFSGTTTSSTSSRTCDIGLVSTSYQFPVTTSETATSGAKFSVLTSTATALVIGSTNTHTVSSCIVGGPGAVAAITIAASCRLKITLTEIVGATPNVITGAGTIDRGYLVFTGTGSTITVVTQNALVVI